MGLAVGQTITATATALPVMKANNGEPDWAEFEKLVTRWRPNAFVVGMPYNMDGTENDMTARTSTFIASLIERYNIPCHAIDERLSTREARDLSRANAQAGGRKFNERAEVDSLSAQLILESWLAENA